MAGIALCMSGMALAQVEQGGTVVDARQHAVAGATVLLSQTGQDPIEVMTDTVGHFQFSGQSAPYDITVTSPTYDPVRVLAVNFASGPVVLHVGNPTCQYRTENGKCADLHAWNEKPWDFGLFIQGGNGLEDRTGFHFFSAGAYLGKVLTPGFGPGRYRANFEYGVEVLPLWQSYTPKFQRINCPYNATSATQCSAPTTTGGTYRGISIVPIVLRLNLRHGAKFEPWLQGAGGVIYTTRKFPPIGNTNYLDPSQTAPNADTSVWNFDPQFGIGAHYFLNPRRSVDVSANAVHISSSSLGDKNPGINTGVQFTLGYSWWK